MAARSSLTRRPRPSQRAQHNLAKVGVEGSNPFARSKQIQRLSRYLKKALLRWG